LGQTWTTFTDPDNKPDALDLEGPAGVIDTRQAQFRYTKPLGNGHSLAFSVERPDVQAPTLSPGGQATDPAPDFAARYLHEADQWHTQISSLYRAIGYNSGPRTQTIFGWGLNESLSIMVFGRYNMSEGL
jgi:lysozyme family protein